MTDPKKFEVVDVVEHEDGSATFTFELDRSTDKIMTELGIKFLLFCASVGLTTEEGLHIIINQGG